MFASMAAKRKSSPTKDMPDKKVKSEQEEKYVDFVYTLLLSLFPVTTFSSANFIELSFHC